MKKFLNKFGIKIILIVVGIIVISNVVDLFLANYKLKNIHFEGKISYNEVMALCNQTDIFVHPSMYPEGLPTSILEAGLMKNAVIATDRGGTVEVINDPKYGIIMEENLESLKTNLQYLLDNPEKIETLKEILKEEIDINE